MNFQEIYSEMESILNSIKQYRIDEYLILNFYLKTGIRLSECTKIDDVLFLNANIIVIDANKNSEKRIFTKDDFQELSNDEYVNMFYFIYNTTPSKVKVIMKKYTKRIKFPDYLYHCKTHLMRYLYVSKLKSDGLTVEEIQKKLGHKNISSTHVYFDKCDV